MKVLILSLLFLIVSCGHHRDVRPGASGVHRVTFQAEDQGQAARTGMDQANHFCDQSGKTAAIIDEEFKYTGDMDEASYKKAKRISKAAEIVGGTVWATGGKKESGVGGVVGLGGSTADAVIGQGYTLNMTFKCVSR